MVISSRHMSKLFKQCVIHICIYWKVNFGPQGEDILRILYQRRIKIGHEVNPLYITQLT